MPDSAPRILAQDVMVHDVTSVQSQAPINHAAKLMGQQGIRHLAVTDELGRLVGLFSERDLLHYIARCSVAVRSSIGRMPVSDLMIRNPLTACAETTLPEIARMLAENKIGCMPIVDERNRLSGIVTVTDILRHVAEGCSGTPAAVIDIGHAANDAAAFEANSSKHATTDEDFWE